MPCFFDLPLVVGGVVLAIGGVVYFAAAWRGEQWQPLVEDKDAEGPRKGGAIIAAPTRAPPRLVVPPAAAAAAAAAPAAANLEAKPVKAAPVPPAKPVARAEAYAMPPAPTAPAPVLARPTPAPRPRPQPACVCVPAHSTSRTNWGRGKLIFFHPLLRAAQRRRRCRPSRSPTHGAFCHTHTPPPIHP